MKKNELEATSKKELSASDKRLKEAFGVLNPLHASNELVTLGYDMAAHFENAQGHYETSLVKEVDGEKVTVLANITDEQEKQAVDELDLIMNMEAYSLPKQCALYAFIESIGTYKNYGVKFSDYVQSFNPKLKDNTIRQYMNVGKCFMKASKEPQWVDERLKGVSVTNLCAVLSTFKAYADKKELEGAQDYRDYVGAFLDEYGDKIHLHANTQQVKDECATLAGRKTSEERKADKAKKGTNKEGEIVNLSDTDALLLALKNYCSSKDADKKALELAMELVKVLTPATDISMENGEH